jgi:HK97 gp10 family phage protein
MADFDVSVTMTGLDDLKAKLDSVIYETRYKGGRFALRKSAQVFVKAAQSNARQVDDPATARNIASNIAERWNGRLYKTTGDLGFRIGVKGGARFSGRNRKIVDAADAPTPEWRAVEFGTETTPAHPFLRPAVLGNLQTGTNVFISEFGKAIERAIRRAAKAGG